MKLLASLALIFSMLIIPVSGGVPDLWVLVGEFTGLDPEPRYVGFYANGGMRTRYDMPLSSAELRYGTHRRIRDLVQDEKGTLWTLGGTRGAVLTRVDLAGNKLETVLGNIVFDNQSPRGGMALSGHHLYFTYNSTSPHNDYLSMIVRVDVRDMSVICFAEGFEALDVAVSDGRVYAISKEGIVRVYNEASLIPLKSLKLNGDEHYGIALSDNGLLFTAGIRKADGETQNVIRKFSPWGRLVGSLDVPVKLMGDIDIDKDGQIALSTVGSGLVLVTDTRLARYETFKVTESSLGGDIFLTLASVSPPVSAPAELSSFLVSTRWTSSPDP